MAYTKTVWENLSSTNTPVNASNLNKIENELEILDEGEDISSNITLNESGSALAIKKGNFIFVDFFGEIKYREKDQVLFTISSEYRPVANTRAIFVTSGGEAVGNVVFIASNGEVLIEGITTNVTGRVFFQAFYKTT